MSEIRQALEALLGGIRVGPDRDEDVEPVWAYRPGCWEHGRGIPQRLAEALHGKLIMLLVRQGRANR